MQITREDLPDRQVALTLEFEPQEIEPALQKTYQRLVGKVNIPGFRPGKAPRQLFERYVGREALIREASESLTAPAIKDALDREELQGAELLDVDIQETDPLRLRVLLDRGPLVEVPDYYDIRVPAEPVEVTPEQVDEVIDRLRSRDAAWHEPEEPRPARLGDRVTVDLETFTIDGPVTQMTGPEQVLELSEKTGPAWPREIDENLLGMTAGEEKDFAITFPEAYTDEALRGKEATVHAKVTKIEESELPELNEEFAQRVGQVDTIEELRAKIEESLLAEATSDARGKQMRAAIDQLKARSHVEVSHALIDQEIERRYERLTEELQRRRIAPARYFTYEGTSERAWREGQHGPAREALEELLVLGEFARREKIEVDEDEVAGEIDKLLAPYSDNPQVEQLRGIFDTEEQRESIRNRLFEQKLTDRMLGIAGGTITEPPAEATEAEASADTEADGAPDAPAAEAAAETSAAEAPAEESAEPETVAPSAGTVPATAQEPGPLEVAGGAAEVLGTGAGVATGDAPGAEE